MAVVIESGAGTVATTARAGRSQNIRSNTGGIRHSEINGRNQHRCKVKEFRPTVSATSIRDASVRGKVRWQQEQK